MRVSFGRQSDRRRGTEGHSSPERDGTQRLLVLVLPMAGLCSGGGGPRGSDRGIEEERFGDPGGAEPLVRPVGGPERSAILAIAAIPVDPGSEAMGFDSE
jgi:hypothetical protein